MINKEILPMVDKPQFDGDEFLKRYRDYIKLLRIQENTAFTDDEEKYFMKNYNINLIMAIDIYMNDTNEKQEVVFKLIFGYYGEYR
jgi:hypothetical protein